MLYKGYAYDSEVELEDDNRKMWHMIIDPNGRTLSLYELPQIFQRVGPYNMVSQEIFETAVDELIQTL